MTFDLKWAAGKFPALKDALGKLDAKREELKAIFEEAGDSLDATKVKAVALADGVSLRDEVKTRNDELEALKGDVDELIETAKAAYAALHPDDRVPSLGENGSEPDRDGSSGEMRDTFGKLFVASQAFTGYKPGQGVGPVAHIDGDLRQIIRNTLFETGAGWAPESTRTGRVEMFPTRPAPHVVDFIPQTTTRQAAVVYMEETTYTNNAVEKAEGAAFGEAALALTERTSTVRKIPVFLPVTDEQFEDEERAEAYVNNRLIFMLQQRLDLQALQGTGVAPLLLGTESVTGIQTQALGGDSIPDAIYKAFVLIRTDGFAEPSVVFITAGNWQDVRLLTTADGIYIWGHPSTPGPFTIWGVPVVETQAAPATKAIAGDYSNFSELAVRRGVDVQVSNSHDDYFVKGKLAVRADMRVALVHYRPKAFAEITGL